MRLEGMEVFGGVHFFDGLMIGNIRGGIRGWRTRKFDIRLTSFFYGWRVLSDSFLNELAIRTFLGKFPHRVGER